MSDITLIDMMTPDPVEKISTNLGILYLYSVLKKEGIDVEFKDYRNTKFDDPLEIETIVNYLSDSARIVAIGCQSNTLAHVIVAIKYLKQKHPGKIIILGGSGPTSISDKLIEKFEFIDMIMLGESEETIVEVTKALLADKELDGIQGIYFKKNGKVVKNKLRCRINDLDKLPYPDYGILDLKIYAPRIITARGCPFNCTFCNIGEVWQHRTTYRKIDKIIAEIKYMKDKYGFRAMNLSDDTFMTNKQRVLEFCTKLKKENINIRWSCFGRIDLVDDELMGEMAKAGCEGIFYGLEAAADKVLISMNKRFSPKKAIETIMKSQKYFKDGVMVSFIWGFPYENMQDFLDTLYISDYFADNNIRAQIHLLCMFPNTKIYEQYRNNLRFSNNLIPDLALPQITKEIQKYKCIKKKLVVSYMAPPVFRNIEVLQLIKENPEIFPQYYHIHTPELDDKLKVMELFVIMQRLDIKNIVIVFEKFVVIMAGKEYVYIQKSDTDYKERLNEHVSCLLDKDHSFRKSANNPYIFRIEGQNLIVVNKDLFNRIKEIKSKGLIAYPFEISMAGTKSLHERCSSCRYFIRNQCDYYFLL